MPGGEKKMPGEQTSSEKKTGRRETREFHGVHDRLAEIIRTVSGVPDLQVVTTLQPDEEAEMRARGQEPHDTWFFRPELDPKTKALIGGYVRIPETIVEVKLEHAKATAGHEGAHVAITRYPQVVPDEVMQQPGFSALMAGAEERPTDQAVRVRFPGTAGWMDSMRRDLVDQGLERREDYKEQYGDYPRQPKFEQLANYIVFAPHYDAPPPGLDPDVLAAYEAMQADVELMENTLPAKGAKESEVVDKARERYRQVYRKMWPRFKELYKQDLAEEKQREVLRRAMGENADESADISDKAREMIKQLLNSADQEPTGDLKDIKLSPELTAALQKAFEELTPEEQQKIIDKAKKTLEKIEDKVVTKLRGALQSGVETHAEFAERKEQEAAEEERQQAGEKRRQEAQEAIDKLKKEIEEKPEDEYQTAYEQIAAYDDDLYRRLDEIFHPQKKGRMRLRSTGNRLNLPAVFRWEADRRGGAPVVNNDLYESRDLPQKRDYAFTLLVDLSGSMTKSGKIQNAFAGVILVSEVLSRLGIPLEVLGFRLNITPLKAFGEELNDETRRRIGDMLPAVTGSRRVETPFDNSIFNADGPCLLDASDRLKENPAQKKMLLVFSDGLPAAKRFRPEPGQTAKRGSAKEPQPALKEAVAKILNEKDQHLIGLGLGSDTEHVKDFYPTAIPNIPVEELAEVLSNLLEDIILHPENY